MELFADRVVLVTPRRFDSVQLEHDVDRQIRARLTTGAARRIATSRDWSPIEAVSEVHELDAGVAALMFDHESFHPDSGYLRVHLGPEFPTWTKKLRSVTQQLVMPLQLRQALMVMAVVGRWDASPRAIAELVHGMWPWATWAPKHNQLVGTQLIRTACRLRAIARGEPAPADD